MRLSVDEKNKVVVALGHYKGKTIKAVARCHSEDTFDRNIGIEIAKKKYNVKLTRAKINWHEKNIRYYTNMVSTLISNINYEEGIVKDMKDKLNEINNVNY